MASRSHTTFKKRQKELARVEKQRDKTAKRMQRKDGERDPEAEMTLEEAAILRGQDLPIEMEIEVTPGPSGYGRLLHLARAPVFHF